MSATAPRASITSFMVPFRVEELAFVDFVSANRVKARSRLRAFIRWWKRHGVLVCDDPAEWLHRITSQSEPDTLVASMTPKQVSFCASTSQAAFLLDPHSWEDRVQFESAVRCSSSEILELFARVSPLAVKVRLFDRYGLSPNARVGWESFIKNVVGASRSRN